MNKIQSIIMIYIYIYESYRYQKVYVANTIMLSRLHPSECKTTLLAAKDLMQKYHQNSAIVQELINGKVSSGAYREHPELPGNIEP